MKKYKVVFVSFVYLLISCDMGNHDAKHQKTEKLEKNLSSFEKLKLKSEHQKRDFQGTEGGISSVGYYNDSEKAKERIIKRIKRELIDSENTIFLNSKKEVIVRDNYSYSKTPLYSKGRFFHHYVTYLSESNITPIQITLKLELENNGGIKISESEDDENFIPILLVKKEKIQEFKEAISKEPNKYGYNVFIVNDLRDYEKTIAPYKDKILKNIMTRDHSNRSSIFYDSKSKKMNEEERNNKKIELYKYKNNNGEYDKIKLEIPYFYMGAIPYGYSEVDYYLKNYFNYRIENISKLKEFLEKLIKYLLT